MSMLLRTSLRSSLPRSYRSFTSTAAKMGKQEWVFIIPDKANALEARIKVRPQHLEALKPHVESGAIVLGGASLDEPLKDGVDAKTNGSVMIIASDTEAGARKIIEDDIYYTSGVWDVEKIKMMPFRSAIRQSL